MHIQYFAHLMDNYEAFQLHDNLNEFGSQEMNLP